MEREAERGGGGWPPGEKKGGEWEENIGYQWVFSLDPIQVKGTEDPTFWNPDPVAPLQHIYWYVIHFLIIPPG